MSLDFIPPILVSDSGDIQVFADESELANELEAVDVKENAYAAYDSEGRRLTLGTRRGTRRILRFITAPVERVVIVGVEPPLPAYVAELQALLRHYLSQMGIDAGDRELRALVRTVSDANVTARRTGWRR